MSPDTATELWLRLLAGKEVTAEEKRDLLETLRKDEELRLKLLRDEEFDGMLRTLGWVCQDAEAFAREFSDGRSAEDDAARFARRVEAEINKPGNSLGPAGDALLRPGRRPPARWIWICGWAAAGLLLCLTAVWRLSGSSPAELERNPVDETAIGSPKLERAEGEVFLLAGGGKKKITAGRELRAGQRLEVGPGSRGIVVFPDKTRIEVMENSQTGEILEACRKDGHGKCVPVIRGAIVAEATSQPVDLPMVCRTPQGEAKVLGTKFRITVDPDPRNPSTRLEVTEGKVEFKRSLDGKIVQVLSGFYVVVAAGTEMAVERIDRPR